MDGGEEGAPLKRLLSQHPRAGRWLSPFLLTCSVSLLWTPELQPSWPAALLKCLPVVCLVLFLGAVPTTWVHTSLLQGALLCSVVGDACLVWPETFLHGYWLLTDAPGVQENCCCQPEEGPCRKGVPSSPAWAVGSEEFGSKEWRQCHRRWFSRAPLGRCGVDQPGLVLDKAHLQRRRAEPDEDAEKPKREN
ncbi:lysoplasmalogenase isoform X2 [Fukomys damarensis]|uniref:lysoplasmalogenase isoform X2 n=1 Tax=Fukomys damarensis TaxID=885580 RepID=UPI001455071C|nr:lysoplasmalogenase isoform X2 [Fukomys damarensis]